MAHSVHDPICLVGVAVGRRSRILTEKQPIINWQWLLKREKWSAPHDDDANDALSNQVHHARLSYAQSGSA